MDAGDLQNEYVGFRLSRKLVRQLDVYASRHGVSKSEVVRRALEEYLAPSTRVVQEETYRVVNEQALEEVYDD